MCMPPARGALHAGTARVESAQLDEDVEVVRDGDVPVLRVEHGAGA
jgi:hypothetical protein